VVSCVSHVAHFLRKQFLKIVQTEWEPFSASKKGPVWPNQHTIVAILSLLILYVRCKRHVVNRL
jgi:hypothetical protein